MPTPITPDLLEMTAQQRLWYRGKGRVPGQDVRRVFLSLLDQILEDSPGVYVGAGARVDWYYGKFQLQNRHGRWTVPYPGCALHKIEDPIYYYRILRYLENDRHWIFTSCTGPYDGIDFSLTKAGVDAAAGHFNRPIWND